MKPRNCNLNIAVSRGQIQFEFAHLQKKLHKRDALRFKEQSRIRNIKTHPMFVRNNNKKIETWEKV
jgi:hypothetical protein